MPDSEQWLTSDDEDAEIGRRLQTALDRATAEAPPPRNFEFGATPNRRKAFLYGLAAAAAVVVVVFAALAITAGDRDATGRVVAQSSATPVRSASTSPSGESSNTTSPAPGCSVYAPKELPDGSPAGAGQQLGKDKWIWGAGVNRVTQLVGSDELGLLKVSAAEDVKGSRIDGRMISIGDPGTGQVAFAFEHADCAYTVWLEGGTSLDDARAFIRTY
jgi:hypothetical protein